MMKHIKYASYVLRHKWFVFVECYRMGILWRGLMHDLSKVLPSEWFPYVVYFYGLGSFDTDRDFDLAWLKHQHRNPHHWQFWLLREDSGGTKVLEMPLAYRKEMLADWRGAGRAQGKTSPNECRDWYLANAHKMLLGPETRAWIEDQLGAAMPEGCR
jgi:hypothetical protein